MNNMLMSFRLDESDKYAGNNNNYSEYNNNMDFLSTEGRDELNKRISEALAKKPEITQRIQAARMQGGLEENEELLTALDDMQTLDMELHRLQEILETATVIQPLSKGKYKTVVLGCHVKLENMDNGNKVKYQILGEFESDPTKGSISFRSPLGKELIGSKKRDIVAIMRPAGDIEYEILDIFVP
ncbi:MAG: hypothetical protein CBB97_09415 [Candidatus Endolissoclinum sp. TMED37]|nr:MAG: hypothetical protein CBB97_09415 [Candidatus Endolissoclinum sp. TMED37]